MGPVWACPLDIGWTPFGRTVGVLVSDTQPTPLELELSHGVRVVARSWSCSAPRATVLVLPALGVRASFYKTVAGQLCERGFAVTTIDHRGHGESSVAVRRDTDFGYAELVADLLGTARRLRSASSAPLVFLGHSLGGHLAVLAAGAEPELADGIALVASGTPYHASFPARDALRIRALAGAMPLLTRVVGYFPGNRIGFGGRESRGVMRDWAKLALHGHFSLQGHDPHAWLRQVRAPVLAISLEGDSMAPPAALEHLLAMLPSAQIQREHLTLDRCEPRALDHLRWAQYPAAVADLLDEWWQRRAAAR